MLCLPPGWPRLAEIDALRLVDYLNSTDLVDPVILRFLSLSQRTMKLDGAPLNSWWSPCKNCTPGDDNSNLIKTEKAVPIIPAKTEKIK
jgi:hypothetical protein